MKPNLTRHDHITPLFSVFFIFSQLLYSIEKWGTLGRAFDDANPKISNFPPKGFTIAKVGCGWSHFVVGLTESGAAKSGVNGLTRLFGWGRNDKNQLGNWNDLGDSTKTDIIAVKYPIEIVPRIGSDRLEDFGVLSESIVFRTTMVSNMPKNRKSNKYHQAQQPTSRNQSQNSNSDIEKWRDSLPKRQKFYGAGWGDHGNCGGKDDTIVAPPREILFFADSKNHWEGSRQRKLLKLSCGGAFFVAY
mgnify:CR=1 FL=1